MTAGRRLGRAIVVKQHRPTGFGSSRPPWVLSSCPRSAPIFQSRPSAFKCPVTDRCSFASKTPTTILADSSGEGSLSASIATRSCASLAYGPCPVHFAVLSTSTNVSACSIAEAPKTNPHERVSGVQTGRRVLSQRRGAGRIEYIVDGEGRLVQRASISADSARTPQEDVYHQRITALFYRIFLPTDFPASVTSNYLQFTGAMSAQVLLSNVSRVLATQAMLLALGFGSQTALPFAAVSAWILKDGLGHLGAIGVGTVVNRRFDSDPKRFRFFASVIGKVADILSIFTLGWPQYFLALSTLGSTCGRISSGTALSCRAKIYETFALDSNLGDVMRCSQAQSTAAQLLGTGIGVLLGPIIGCDMFRLFMVNGIFSVATLACSYFASKAVRMTSFNLQRAEIVFHRLISGVLSSESESGTLEVMSTYDVQAAEVFVSQYRSAFDVPLAVNPLMLDRHWFFTPSDGYLEAKHVLAVEPRTCARPDIVALWIRERASPSEVLRGFFQACILRVLLAKSASELAGPASEQLRLSEFHARSKDLVGSAESRLWWPNVQDALIREGWRTDVVFLDTKDGRLSIA